MQLEVSDIINILDYLTMHAVVVITCLVVCHLHSVHLAFVGHIMYSFQSKLLFES